MQLGLSTYSFPWAVGVDGYTPPDPFSAEQLLQFAAQHGIKHIQFGDNYPLQKLSNEELHQLATKADKFGISLQVGTSGLTVENIDIYINIAVLLKAPFIRMVIDTAAYQPGTEDAIQIIKSVMPQLKESKVRLAIENHDRFAAKTLQYIITKTDPDSVGICLDTANSLGAGEGINEVVKFLAPHTINLHIKDITIKRLPHKMGFNVRGCIAGEGVLDIPWLVEEVGQYQRCDTATLEVWSEPKKEIQQTIEKEKEWVTKSIAYLKTIIT